MKKKYPWEEEFASELKRSIEEMKIAKMKEDLSLTLKRKFGSLDSLKNEIDPLGLKSQKINDPLHWKEQHREFVGRHKAKMENEMKMREQLNFEAEQKRMEDMRLQQDSQRLFENHFDNMERNFGPIKEPLMPKFKV
jgi:hypothetical protein